MDERRFLALVAAEGLPATPKNLTRLSREFGPELARWASQQWELRRRAVSKFSRACEMFFDRDGLEMATHEDIAAYHASRFPEGIRVVEVGGGIGADTIALARRGPVTTYEIDFERTQTIAHNLRVHRLSAQVVEGDGMEVGSADYVFADPARRSSAQRRLSLSELQPSPHRLVDRFGQCKLLGIKLSPMTSDGDLAELTAGRQARIEFVSFGRECRESLVWLGDEVRSPGRFAVHVESGESIADGEPVETVPMPRAFLYEADPAAIRVHSLGRFNLLGLGDSNGYLTGDALVPSPWLRCYRVLYSGKADNGETKRVLARLGAGTPVVKQRGADIDPSKLAKVLSGPGSRDLAVVIWRVGKSVRHAVVETLDLP